MVGFFYYFSTGFYTAFVGIKVSLEKAVFFLNNVSSLNVFLDIIFSASLFYTASLDWKVAIEARVDFLLFDPELKIAFYYYSY